MSVRAVSARAQRDPLDVANKTAGPLEVDHVRNHRANRSNEEPVHERYPEFVSACPLSSARYKPHTVVNPASREYFRRTNDTPDHTCGTKHLRARADEAILLCRAANVRDIREHPGLYTKLDRPCNHGSDNLACTRVSNPTPYAGKERWWDIHQNIGRGGTFM